jgi:AcrR family transcriptional regulator
LPREERREQLLDAALALLAREGWPALRVEKVAAEANIAKSVVYAVFGSPDGLVSALLAREHQRATTSAGAALLAATSAASPPEAIEAALNTFLERVEHEPDTWRMVLLPTEGTPQFVQDISRTGRDRWWRVAEPVIREMLAAAGLDGVDPELASHILRGNAEYFARLMLEDPERFARKRLTEFVSDLARRVPWGDARQ